MATAETTKAISQAVMNPDNQYEICRNFALTWVKLKSRGEVFTSEDLIDAYKASILPQPEDYRVFGGIILELKSSDVIGFHGFSRYKGRQGHGKPCNVWIRK
jgi:hypothetical protein